MKHSLNQSTQVQTSLSLVKSSISSDGEITKRYIKPSMQDTILHSPYNIVLSCPYLLEKKAINEQVSIISKPLIKLNDGERNRLKVALTGIINEFVIAKILPVAIKENLTTLVSINYVSEYIISLPYERNMPHLTLSLVLNALKHQKTSSEFYHKSKTTNDYFFDIIKTEYKKIATLIKQYGNNKNNLEEAWLVASPKKKLIKSGKQNDTFEVDLLKAQKAFFGIQSTGFGGVYSKLIRVVPNKDVAIAKGILDNTAVRDDFYFYSIARSYGKLISMECTSYIATQSNKNSDNVQNAQRIIDNVDNALRWDISDLITLVLSANFSGLFKNLKKRIVKNYEVNKAVNYGMSPMFKKPKEQKASKQDSTVADKEEIVELRQIVANFDDTFTDCLVDENMGSGKGNVTLSRCYKKVTLEKVNGNENTAKLVNQQTLQELRDLMSYIGHLLDTSNPKSIVNPNNNIKHKDKQVRYLLELFPFVIQIAESYLQNHDFLAYHISGDERKTDLCNEVYQDLIHNKCIAKAKMEITTCHNGLIYSVSLLLAFMSAYASKEMANKITNLCIRTGKQTKVILNTKAMYLGLLNIFLKRKDTLARLPQSEWLSF